MLYKSKTYRCIKVSSQNLSLFGKTGLKNQHKAASSGHREAYLLPIQESNAVRPL
jgi:hypothetical protein